MPLRHDVCRQPRHLDGFRVIVELHKRAAAGADGPLSVTLSNHIDWHTVLRLTSRGENNDGQHSLHGLRWLALISG